MPGSAGAPGGDAPNPPFAPPLQGQSPPPVNPFAPPAQASVPRAAAATPPTAAPTPPPASASAPPSVQGEVAELRSTLQELQAIVAGLVQKAQESTVPTGTPDTDRASRIIVMANQAAEGTIEDARAEAAEILARAQAHSIEIIAAARELANQELAAERVRVATATSDWHQRRGEIAAHLADLEATILGYRGGLIETAAAIRAAAAELEDDGIEPPVISELPAPDPSGFIGAELPGADTLAAHEAAADAERSAEAVVDLTDHSAVDPAGESVTGVPETSDDLAASPRTSLFGATAAPERPEDVPAHDVAVADAAADAGDGAAPADEQPSPPTLRPGLFGR